MSTYRRLQVCAASIFFSVALADRQSRLLVDEVARLRWAVAATRMDRPFGIEAWVVLPDHMHCVWTLPANDHDFSTRWRLIKARFSHGLPEGRLRSSHAARQERGIWQRRFCEHHLRDQADMDAHLRYGWFNPVQHGLGCRPG